jgi:hypothetical protein
MTVLGHQQCSRCSDWVANHIAYRSGGLCAPCYAEVGQERTKVVEVRNLGRVLHMDVSTRRTPAYRARRNKYAIERDKTNQRRKDSKVATMRAMRRLRLVFRDVYEIFLSEERAKMGLDPFPGARMDHPVDPEAANRCLEWAAVYDALDHHGAADADTDGPHPPSPPERTR